MQTWKYNINISFLYQNYLIIISPRLSCKSFTYSLISCSIQIKRKKTKRKGKRKEERSEKSTTKIWCGRCSCSCERLWCIDIAWLPTICFFVYVIRVRGCKDRANIGSYACVYVYYPQLHRLSFDYFRIYMKLATPLWSSGIQSLGYTILYIHTYIHTFDCLQLNGNARD